MHSILVVVGPFLGGLLLFNFVIVGPVEPGATPIILEWTRVGIVYGNGEITYHPVILVGSPALIGAGIVSFAIIWRDLEQ